MSAATSIVPTPTVTILDWLRVPESRRSEFIDGRIVFYAMPGPRHGDTQGSVFTALAPQFKRRGDASRPGGWWLSQEVDMELDGLGCRPDLLGWRRDRHPTLPTTDARGLVTAVPDWICEVLSPSTASMDLGRKRIAYFRAGVAHYWLADPERRSITALRLTDEGYVIDNVVNAGERVRLAPFDAVEIDLDDVFEPAAPEVIPGE
jgi:Uma2 family endonuclease